MCLINYKLTGLFPGFDCYKLNCYKLSRVGFCVNVSFYFPGIGTQECNCWVMRLLRVWLFKKLPNCFPECLYHLKFLQQCMRDPAFLHPCQHLFLSLIFILAILTWDPEWYLTVVLIFIPLMADDVEHLFTCLFAICISSLVKYFKFKYFTHFSLGLLTSYCWDERVL